MAGWWETELQGAPGWLELRRDVIAGCTRLIDWPCCWVARDDGHEARSCTAATVSCSPLPLSFPRLFLHYFLIFLLCFLFHSSSLNLPLFYFSFSLCLFVSLSLLLSVSLWLAGFSRLVVVCWGCCTTFCPRMPLSVFWRREKPWISGLSLPLSINQAWPLHIYLYTCCLNTAEMLFRSKKWKWTQLGELVEKREKRGCAFAPTAPQML